MSLLDTIYKHSWRFDDKDDEELIKLHEDFMSFMKKNCERIENIENKYGRKVHLPYFTKAKREQNGQLSSKTE